MHAGGDGDIAMHRHRQTVGVRLDFAVGDHPALLAGAAPPDRVRPAAAAGWPAARCLRHPDRAGNGCPRETPTDRGPGSARSRRWPPAGRPRRPAATPLCRDRRPGRAGSARSVAARCGRTTHRAAPGRPPGGSGRPRPWRRIGIGPAWRASRYAIVRCTPTPSATCCTVMPAGSIGHGLQRIEPAGQRLRAGRGGRRDLAHVSGPRSCLTDTHAESDALYIVHISVRF